MKRNRVKSREDFFENWDQTQQSEFARGVLSIEQRFPGPAGLIPKLQNPESMNDNQFPVSQVLSRILQMPEPGTPDRAILTLPKDPWRNLVTSLQLNPSLHATLEWIDQRYPHLSHNDKDIPFLAVVLEEEPARGRIQEQAMSVKCMDATGSFLLSIDSQIVTAYSSYLRRGSAVAMHNVNVLRVPGKSKMIVLPSTKLVFLSSMNDNGDAVKLKIKDFDLDKAAYAFSELNSKLD